MIPTHTSPKRQRGSPSLALQASVRGVTIVGAGGIGCAVGYLLRQRGVHVTFIESNPHKVRWGRTHGVAVDDRPPLPAVFVPFDRWRPRVEDCVLLCTKSYHNAEVSRRLSPTATLIPIQNGFDLSLPVGPEGIASFVSECHPDRPHTRITRRGKLHLGRDDALPASLRPLASGLGIRVEMVPDILPFKYTKLMYNAAISPLASAAGIDNGRLLSNLKARRLFFELLRENYDILTAAGVPLATIGPFSPHTVQRILARRWLASALSWAFTPTLSGTYCSMARDLPAGRTEIDAYNGYLLRLAGDRPAPLNRRVLDLVRRMEQNREPPGAHTLDELLS